MHFLDGNVAVGLDGSLPLPGVVINPAGWDSGKKIGVVIDTVPEMGPH